MKRQMLAAAIAMALTAGLADAEVIGKMETPQALTEARLASLPAAEREAWQAYLDRSRKLKDADLAQLMAERESLRARAVTGKGTGTGTGTVSASAASGVDSAAAGSIPAGSGAVSAAARAVPAAGGAVPAGGAVSATAGAVSAAASSIPAAGGSGSAAGSSVSVAGGAVSTAGGPVGIPPASPAPAAGGNGMPLKNPAPWYGSAPALRVADNIVSYQTPAGGWGKNVDRSGPPRQPGEAYVHGDAGKAEGWSYVGTIDNDATITELRFLARVISSGQDRYRPAFQRGLEYLFNAQYPNGGLPQVYPLSGGYHDAITYNDNALANVTDLLEDVALRKGDYSFVAPALAARAAQSRDKAEQVIIASQIKVGGVLTAWCQQHDAVTLAPVGARNFEPIALTSVESARLLNVLMRDPAPSPAIVAAVDAGAAWLKRVAIYDQEWVRPKQGTSAGASQSASLMPKPGAGPLWARLYDIATMRPIFGDRDRTIHTDVNELSPERRAGYAWYVNNPASTLDKYARWAAKYSATGK